MALLTSKEVYRQYRLAKETNPLILHLLRISLDCKDDRARFYGFPYRIDGRKELLEFVGTIIALEKDYPGIIYDSAELINTDFEPGRPESIFCQVIVRVDILDRWRTDQGVPLEVVSHSSMLV